MYRPIVRRLRRIKTMQQYRELGLRDQTLISVFLIGLRYFSYQAVLNCPHEAEGLRSIPWKKFWNSRDLLDIGLYIYGCVCVCNHQHDSPKMNLGVPHNNFPFHSILALLSPIPRTQAYNILLNIFHPSFLRSSLPSTSYDSCICVCVYIYI